MDIPSYLLGKNAGGGGGTGGTNGDFKAYVMRITSGVSLSRAVAINSTDTNDLQKMSTIITQGYSNGLDGIYFGNNTENFIYFLSLNTALNSKPTTIWFGNEIMIYANSDDAYHTIFAGVEVTGTWNDNTFTCTKVKWSPVQNKSGLGYITTWGNTNEYTPTGQYNPATKKYVDSKTWIGTQQEYDNLQTYSDGTLYFIKET